MHCPDTAASTRPSTVRPVSSSLMYSEYGMVTRRPTSRTSDLEAKLNRLAGCSDRLMTPLAGATVFKLGLLGNARPSSAASAIHISSRYTKGCSPQTPLWPSLFSWVHVRFLKMGGGRARAKLFVFFFARLDSFQDPKFSCTESETASEKIV